MKKKSNLSAASCISLFLFFPSHSNKRAIRWVPITPSNEDLEDKVTVSCFEETQRRRRPRHSLSKITSTGDLTWKPSMDQKLRYGKRYVIASNVIFHGLIAFTCCIAAEFKKAKVRDLRLDGNLCSLLRTPAFGLGITAIVCLSIAQIIGTSASSSRLCPKERKSSTAANGRKSIMPITLLVLSWISFGLAMILLSTASSMNNGQSYGRGWQDGQCYIVNRGVYLGSAVLVLATISCILGFMFPSTKVITRTLPDELAKGEKDNHTDKGDA